MYWERSSIVALKKKIKKIRAETFYYSRKLYRRLCFFSSFFLMHSSNNKEENNFQPWINHIEAHINYHTSFPILYDTLIQGRNEGENAHFNIWLWGFGLKFFALVELSPHYFMRTMIERVVDGGFLRKQLDLSLGWDF